VFRVCDVCVCVRACVCVCVCVCDVCVCAWKWVERELECEMLHVTLMDRPPSFVDQITDILTTRSTK
jgi:hypothetical protein